MAERIVVTICSREKSDAPGFIPAIDRYLGPHVAFAAKAARQADLQFFILSGKFGLVAERQAVCNYDYRLTDLDIDRVVSLVAHDLRLMHVQTVELYVEPNKDSWKPYIAVIEQAAQKAGVLLVRHEIACS